MGPAIIIAVVDAEFVERVVSGKTKQFRLHSLFRQRSLRQSDATCYRPIPEQVERQLAGPVITCRHSNINRLHATSNNVHEHITSTDKLAGQWPCAAEELGTPLYHVTNQPGVSRSGGI